MTMPGVEVITSVERRWSREEKERLVAVSFAPGVAAFGRGACGRHSWQPAVSLAQAALRGVESASTSTASGRDRVVSACSHRRWGLFRHGVGAGAFSYRLVA